MYKQISIQQLKPGMVIIGITQQNGPVKIRKSGLVTSPEMVQGLAEMGVLQLEIDPQQTVELDVAPADIKPSATQQLLSQQGKEQQQLDHSLSEQFNRSLFLPSVQDIPSAWQHYMRQGLTALTVSLAGVLIGFTIAKAPQWFNTEVKLVQKEQPQQPVVETEPEATPEPAPVQQVAMDNSDQTGSQVEAQPESTEVVQNTPVSNEPEVLGTVVTPETTPTLDTSAISPELLQKFQQAVSEIKPEEPTDFEQEQQIADSGEVLRVDQLPAWVLTELPSMSFSAHMYASAAQQRWVRVNGIEMGEGDWIDNKVRIESIEPQKVIMNYKGHEFSMRALTDW